MIKNMNNERYFVKREIKIENGKQVKVANINALKSLNDIDDLESYEKCLLLINAGKLLELADEYSFTMNPDNLFFDSALNIQVNEYKPNFSMEGITDNLKEYKALVASSFGDYAFDDYINGGDDLYLMESKHGIKSMYEVFKAQSIDAIYDFLTNLANNYKRERDTNFTVIPKNKDKIYRRLTPILIGVSVICILFTGYLFFFKHYNNKIIIDAYGYYISGDYAKVADAVKDVNLSGVPYEAKVMLARSYVSLESFTNKNATVQREMISKNITTSTDEKYLNYWIELGRLNFDDAIDYAKQLSDNELLYYALIKEKDFVNKDTSMSGAEKEKKLNNINTQINSLKEKLNMPKQNKGVNENKTDTGEIKLEN